MPQTIRTKKKIISSNKRNAKKLFREKMSRRGKKNSKSRQKTSKHLHKPSKLSQKYNGRKQCGGAYNLDPRNNVLHDNKDKFFLKQFSNSIPVIKDGHKKRIMKLAIIENKKNPTNNFKVILLFEYNDDSEKLVGFYPCNKDDIKIEDRKLIVNKNEIIFSNHLKSLTIKLSHNLTPFSQKKMELLIEKTDNEKITTFINFSNENPKNTEKLLTINIDDDSFFSGGKWYGQRLSSSLSTTYRHFIDKLPGWLPGIVNITEDNIIRKLEPSLQTLDNIKYADKLGEGTFGNVYKGTYNDTQVAIKQIKELPDEETNNKILHEINILQKIKGGHPNLLKFIGTANFNIVHSIEEQRTGFGIVTEICDGSLEDQREYLHKDIQMLRNCLLQIAEGMKYLHSMGIIHRDLKPANVLYTENNEADGVTNTYKIADFGLSQDGTDDMGEEDCKIGTPVYMAPELFSYDSGCDLFFNKQLPFACDVYSYGIMANELLMNQTPYDDVMSTFTDPIMDSFQNYVIQGDRPQTKESSIKELIQNCWASQPDIRPNFDAIIAIICHLVPTQDSTHKPLTHNNQ